MRVLYKSFGEANFHKEKEKETKRTAKLLDECVGNCLWLANCEDVEKEKRNLPRDSKKGGRSHDCAELLSNQRINGHTTIAAWNVPLEGMNMLTSKLRKTLITSLISTERVGRSEKSLLHGIGASNCALTAASFNWTAGRQTQLLLTGEGTQMSQGFMLCVSIIR